MLINSCDMAAELGIVRKRGRVVRSVLEVKDESTLRRHCWGGCDTVSALGKKSEQLSQF